MSKVKAKFMCSHISDDPERQQKTVTFYPVTSGCEENKSFSKYTPGGNIQMIISYETPACDAFEAGKEYFVDFTPAE